MKPGKRFDLRNRAEHNRQKRAAKSEERVKTALAGLGSEHAPPPGREARVIATTAQEQLAKQHAQDEMLRREAWRANAPVRAAAQELSNLLGGERRCQGCDVPLREGPTALDVARYAAGLCGACIEERTRAMLSCSGLTARWCPKCGTCACGEDPNELNSAACPLHAPTSQHAEDAR